MDFPFRSGAVEESIPKNEVRRTKSEERSPKNEVRRTKSVLRTPLSLGVAGIAKGWASTTERSLESVGKAHPTTTTLSALRTPHSESARALESKGFSASWI